MALVGLQKTPVSRLKLHFTLKLTPRLAATRLTKSLARIRSPPLGNRPGPFNPLSLEKRTTGIARENLQATNRVLAIIKQSSQ